MELLAPLARRSRIVTALLANEMGVLARLLSVISEPLTLSLGAAAASTTCVPAHPMPVPATLNRTPLCVSLPALSQHTRVIVAGLDVLEEVLIAIGSRARTAMATYGVVGALARLLNRKVTAPASQQCLTTFASLARC